MSEHDSLTAIPEADQATAWDEQTPEFRAQFIAALQMPNAGVDRSIAQRDSKYNLSDAGNGELLAYLEGARWRFDHARGRDLLFVDHHWRQNVNHEMVQIAKEAARYRYLAAKEIIGTEERRKTALWALQSESKAKIEAALAMARSEPPIADTGADWDNRPMLLAVANGVVDLEKGTLRNGTREDRLILHTAIAFDPQATCPKFEKFFAEILNRDVDLVDFVLRAIGYSLTGLTTEQVLFILFGSGANGKSVLLSIMRALLGELSYNMPFSTLEMKDRASIPNDVAALADRRLVTAAETNDGARLNEARVKALTGCDPITARFLHSEFFTFKPVAKFWLSVNHKPRVADDSYGFWRRVRLIPFQRQFRDEEADPNLETKLIEELPGILAFFVRGCRHWQARGLKPPASVVAATEEYRADSDPLTQFIEQRCLLGEGLTAGAQSLYTTYKSWAESQGFRDREVLSVTAFGRRMADRFPKRHTASGKVYDGVVIRA